MAKKSKKSSRSESIRPKKLSEPGFPSWLDRPSMETEHDSLYRKIFIIISAVAVSLMIVLALGSGINADDEYHNEYSKSLVNYYSTFGADTTVLNVPHGTMHYYGGMLDILSGFTNKALGFDVLDAGYHKVRHIYNALFGFLAMLFAALFVKHLAGWRAGILALVFMFLSPRFLGHSLMNPKDIPFAAGYMMSLYFMILFLKELPKPGWKTMLGLVVGLMIALGSRVGGLLLFAYLGLFAALDFIIKNGITGLWKQQRTTGQYALYVIGVAITGYFAALLFWPYGLNDPINHPVEVLKDAVHGISIRVLFGGENIMSDATPWYYPLDWIWRTIPLFVIAGLLGAVAMLRYLFKNYQVLGVFIAFFAFVFPLIYIMKGDSVLYDGWRHLQFVYPPMVVVAALSWAVFEKRFFENKSIRWATYVICGLMMLDASLFVVRNPQHPYVYFNNLSGGISAAFGNYETDYWGVSMKEAIDWLDEQGIIKPGMENTVTLGTSFLYNTKIYTEKKYGGKVKLVYTRFNNRYEENWDYGLYVSRYFRARHLKAGTWPNSRNVHSVTANGVPLLSIEKGGGAVFEGEQLLKQQDYIGAVEAFQREVTEHPNNELAWMKMAVAYLSLNQPNEAYNAAENMLRIAPDDSAGLFYKGLSSMYKGDATTAEASLRRAIEIEDKYATAHYYLANILTQRNDLGGALQSLQKAIDANPRFREAYEMAAQIYDQQGNAQQAAAVRAMAAQL